MARTALGFLRARAKLDELIAKSAGQGRMPFADINDFVEGDLFDLKEGCHSYFRSRGHAQGASISSGELFDILVGTLFHQMMMAKENTYQLEAYSPRYAALRRALRGPDPPEHGEAFLREGERLLQRARRALRQDLAHVVEIFSEAAVVLRRAMAENGDNPLLIRMLLGNRPVVEAVYGPKSLDKLLREIYDGHAATGYLVAAADLLDGGRFDRARELCQQARRLEPKNKKVAELLGKINAAARSHVN